MDRLELRTKFSSRIEDFRLEEFAMDLKLRPLSALERARIIDKHRKLEKSKDETENPIETLTIETQCYIVCRGLVDEKGVRIYKDEEQSVIAEEIPGKAIDQLSAKILEISGMTAPSDARKNSSPAPNESSNSDLPPDSGAGTLTNSLLN